MITKIPFGRTGHQSSRVIFGAFAVGFVPQKRADEILDLLLRYGINHIDTAPTYGDSELRIGPWMRRYRDEFFLATKTGERTKAAAAAEIQQSLERLQVDTIDLLQLHNLVDPEEWATALGPGNSVARRHILSLDRFSFDSVLLPYNYEFMHKTNLYPADFEELYERCQANNIAMQTIKSVARGLWGDKEQTRGTWYEPLEVQHEIDAAVAFVLNKPNIFLNSSGDPDLLPRTLDAAARYSAGEPFEAVEETLRQMNLRPLFAVGDTA